MKYWRDNEDEHYLEGLSYRQPEKKKKKKKGEKEKRLTLEQSL